MGGRRRPLQRISVYFTQRSLVRQWSQTPLPADLSASGGPFLQAIAAPSVSVAHLAAPPGVLPDAIALGPHGAGWSVCDNGVILRLQQGQWRQQTSPTYAWLRSVSIAPDGQTWAVGWSGRLLREQQGSWSLVGDVTWSQAASASYS